MPTRMGGLVDEAEVEKGIVVRGKIDLEKIEIGSVRGRVKAAVYLRP